MNQEQAKIIIDQLGGNKFIATTGAKSFGFGPAGLSFKHARGANKANYCRIQLTSTDLYDMEFVKIRNCEIATISKHSGLYHDMIRGVFERETGLATSLEAIYSN